MPAVTLTEIIDRAKAAADMHDNFVTPAQWEHWATFENTAAEVDLARAGYVLREASVDITANGSLSYSPFTSAPMASFLAIVGVYHIGTDGLYRRLRNSDPFNRNRQATARYTGDAQSYYAATTGQSDTVTVSLYPVPTSGTYRIFYIPHPKKMRLTVADALTEANSVSYPLGWEERIVLNLAIRAREKEETDTSALDRRLKDVMATIEQAVWAREIGKNPAVRNVDADERPSPYPVWPPVSHWFFP